MKRGPKPQPTDLKKMKGVRPSRINNNEPAFEKAGPMDPPKSFSADAKEFWKEIYPMLLEKSVLKKTDLFAFKELCRIYAELQKVPSAAKSKLFMAYLSEFGLTPSSRSRLSGEGGGEKDSKIKAFLLKGFRHGEGS